MAFATRKFLVASALASAALAAIAQTPPPVAPAAAPAATDARPASAGPRAGTAERRDPAVVQQRMEQGMAREKARLQITAAQEPAWNAFMDAVRPQPGAHARLETDKAEWAKLTTPERIDKMRAMRQQREAAMDRRGEATKTFYAALTPAQQKLFDDRPQHGPHGAGDQGGGARHGMHRDTPHPPAGAAN